MDLRYIKNILKTYEGKSNEFITYQNDKLLKDIDDYLEQEEYESNVYNKMAAVEQFKVEHNILKSEMKLILREGTRETERRKLEEILFNLGSALTYITDIVNSPEINKFNPNVNTEDKKVVGIVRQMLDTKTALEREKMDYISSLATLREEIAREKQISATEDTRNKIILENARKCN